MYTHHLYKSIIAAVLAGEEILKIYDTDFEVEYKDDNSPVTMADKLASEKIIEYLSEFNIPTLSEEGDHPNYDIRKNWDELWIVDPLDGTKEFVKRNGEFTVNIALVKNNKPILGVIYSPVFKDLYFAANGLGSFKINRHNFIPIIEIIEQQGLKELLQLAQKLPINDKPKTYTIVASRSHLSTKTFQHIEYLKNLHHTVETITTGSSIKMCLVAEGLANEYPRFGPSMEWDTAAGQAILEQAGATLIDYETQAPMVYNRKQLLNNWFIAKRD